MFRTALGDHARLSRRDEAARLGENGRQAGLGVDRDRAPDRLRRLDAQRALREWRGTQPAEAHASRVAARGQRRDAGAEQRDVGRACFEAEPVVVARRCARPAERMPLREAHRPCRRASARARTDELGELDGLRDPRGRAQLPDLDTRVVRGQQPLRDLSRGGRIHSLDARRHVPGDRQRARFGLLGLHVEHDERGRGGRRDRLPIRLLQRRQRFRQRLRLRVPLRETAHQRCHVVGSVRLDERVVPARDQQQRRAGVVRLVDGHRSVLQSDRSMQHRAHRPAFGFAVAVGHVHRGLFVQRGDELRHRVRR